jgi:hypothetical protein
MTEAARSVRAPDGRTWSVRRRVLPVRWRAIDPGSEPGRGVASAVPVVIGLVILPLVVFLVELPLLVLRALLGRRCWIVAQSDEPGARLVWCVPRSRVGAVESDLIARLRRGERPAVGV